jgi:predicted aspartyl protease
MPHIPGYLDKSGAPAIKITIAGPLVAGQEFEAIIDTGFSGFVSMPILRGFPLGLILKGTTKVTFADGSTATKLTALGTVTAQGTWKAGVILLEEGSTDILIGMEFLKVFGVSLLVHPPGPLVGLIEDQVVADALKDALAKSGPPNSATGSESDKATPDNPQLEAPAKSESF